MAAVPAAVVALVAQVPVLAHLVVEARLPVLADLVLKARLADLAGLALVAQLLVLAHVAQLVLEAAVPLEQLLSHQSFSAAMARSTP